MAKLGLLIFNGCSFSLFKYILVSVEHALQYLITVCFGLKLIMKHLKGGCAEQLGLSCLRGSSENRSTPSPRGGTVPLLPQALGELCLRPLKLVFFTALVLIRNLSLETGSCCVLALLPRLQPVLGRWP